MQDKKASSLFWSQELTVAVQEKERHYHTLFVYADSDKLRVCLQLRKVCSVPRSV